jgi:hypothetical protein
MQQYSSAELSPRRTNAHGKLVLKMLHHIKLYEKVVANQQLKMYSNAARYL